MIYMYIVKLLIISKYRFSPFRIYMYNYIFEKK